MTCTMNWKIMSRRCLSESSVRINASENYKPYTECGNQHLNPRDTAVGTLMKSLFIQCYNGKCLNLLSKVKSQVLKGKCKSSIFFT